MYGQPQKCIISRVELRAHAFPPELDPFHDAKLTDITAPD
jgi:hypothetical protein